MKPVRFLEEAQDELLEQISYYEERQKGLGDRFRESVEPEFDSFEAQIGRSDA